MQIPVISLLLKGKADLFNEMIGIYTSIKKAVDVGAFIRSGEQVI